MAQVSYGTITITDTNDIERIYMEYAQSSSNSTAPTTGWSEDIPTWEQGKYIWQRTVIKKEGVALSSDSYGDPVCLTGSTGSTGSTGRGVSSIVTTYCNYGTGTPAASYSGWSDTVPSYDSTKPNYWVKTVITYTTGTPATDTKIYQDNGITSATATAASAKTQAAAAEDKADSAVSTADTANTNATNALNVANGVNQHFWWIANDTATTGGTIAAGAYITDIAQSTFKSNPSSYGNLLLRSDGVYLNLGLQTLASFKSNALTFYNSAGTELGKFGSTGLEMSGTLNIKGGGRIGQDSDNYWEFGDNRSYNDEDSAYLIGRGTASIQLGETGHWRLDKNRIHTGWYQLSDSSSSAPAGSLHFDTGADGSSTYYWDYGMHYPNKAGNGNNKFLYIRRSNDTTSTTLATMKGRIDDDTWWTYKFWVDGNGNVHAPGFYIGDSETPIGGGAGTVAERLTQGYGSATQPIYFNSNGVPTNTTYQLNAAGAKGVDTSISAASTSTNLPTSQAVAAFVEGKGYSTTDNKVQTSQANTTKIYLAGTSTAGTSTGTLNFDSNVYLTTTAGTLHATTFDGTSFTGTASRATADGDGNTISTTYLKLSGGNVTGAVSFGSSVSADELTVGDLVVNGSASFTNNLQANTINGVTVGSNPKFTDTTYTFTNGTNGFTVTPLGGTAQTVTVTPSITNNVTGSGTNGYLAKFTGVNTIGNGPALGSDTTKFLNNKGEWTVPAGTYTYTLPLAANGTRGGVQIGYTTSGKNYAVQLSSEKMYVNVPWENTTYESKAAASDGTDISLVTTGEKYTWNQKTSNTGTVTSVATSSPITGGTITSSGTIGHATSGVGNTVTTAGLYKFKYDTYGHVTGVAAVAKSDITGLGIPAQDTTYSNASTTTAGLMSAADKIKLDNIQVDSSGQAVAANVAGRWGIDVTFSDANVAQVGHANSAITASNTQAAKTTASVTSTQLAFGDVINFPYIAYDTYGHVTSKTNLYFKMPAAPSSTGSATNDSDGNPINTTYIKKSIGTAAGDIIYWSASGTPVRLAKGSNGQVLKLANGVPSWGTDNNDNTTYSLSGALSSHKFTTTLTPSSGSATTSAFTLAAGSNITLTDSGTTITIAATDTNTATAVDNILDGSNSGTAITYAPYTSKQSGLSLYTGTTAPDGTTRLNLNGYLYATKLYSNGSEVLTSHQDISGKIDTAGTGLSKSGTTLNHSNSVTAQTTQAVYPIKIDAQGHISGYGSAQTILSLGTGSSNAYRGDYGNTAYTHATDSGRLTTAKTSSFYKFSVTAHGHVGSVTAVAASDITGLLSFGTTYNASSNKIATISDVTGAVSGATNKYVTLDTDQTLVASGTKKYLGLQTYGSNGVAFGVTSDSSITQKVVTKYDSTLDALVFQFS